MNKLQELMIISMEECGELIQRCSKILRRFDSVEDIDDIRRANLLEEAGDVACMLELMVENGVFSADEIEARIAEKREKLKVWSQLFNEKEDS